MLQNAILILLSLASLAILWRTRLLSRPLPSPPPRSLRTLVLSAVVGLFLWLGITATATNLLVQKPTIQLQTPIELEVPSTSPSTPPSTLPESAARAFQAALEKSAHTSPLDSDPRGFLLAILLGYAAAILAMLAFRLPLLPRPLPFLPPNSEIPVPPPARSHIAPILSDILAGLLTLILVWPFVMLTGNLTVFILQFLNISVPTEHDLITLLKSHRSLLPLIALSASVGAPLFEELLFRGHLQPLLTAALARITSAFQAESNRLAPAEPSPITHRSPPTPGNRYAAITLTSLAFASLHPPFSIPAIFVLSLALGLLYERTGRLLPSITCHIAFNTLSLALALLGLST